MKNEEEVEEAPPVVVGWKYKPRDWDHEDLHYVYERLDPEPPIPPENITVCLLDANGEKTPPRDLQANHVHERDNFVADHDHERDNFVLAGAPPISFLNIRYISTNCKALCEKHVKDNRFTIMVSVRRWETVEPGIDPEECFVHNMFIQPESEEEMFFIMNFLRYHYLLYLMKAAKQEEPLVILDSQDPVLLQECTVTVHWRKFQKTWREQRMVVMDQECIIFYLKAFEDAHEPRDRMFFWVEQFRKTVAKVALIKSQRCIFLQCLFMYITLEYDERTGPAIQEAFKKVRPIPRKGFFEPAIMFHFLEGNYDVESGKIKPPAPKVAPVLLDEEETAKLDQYEKELNLGLCSQNPDDHSTTIWINIRPELEQKLVDNRLPAVDHYNWKCDLNSASSVLKYLLDIDMELFRNVNYDKGLSMAVALTNMYLKSPVERLRNLFSDSPVDLLRRIHARGNYLRNLRWIKTREERAEERAEEEPPINDDDEDNSEASGEEEDMDDL